MFRLHNSCYISKIHYGTSESENTFQIIISKVLICYNTNPHVRQLKVYVLPKQI